MALTRLRRSWALTKQAWSILHEHKSLMVFPLLSGTVLTILVGSGIAAAIVAMAAINEDSSAAAAASKNPLAALGPWYYVGLGLLYFVMHFVMAFFQSALLACAMHKMNGFEPTVGYGLRAAATRVPQLLGWSLLNATVGVALQALQEQMGWLGKLILSGIGIVWNIATFFVVPILVIEGIGPVDAVRRSAEIIKKTWGETLVTQFGFTAVTSLVGTLVFLVLAGAGIAMSIAMQSAVPAAILIPLAIVFALLLAIVQSAMKTLLIAATYRFAATGMVSEPFEADTLRGVFKRKGA